MKPIVCCHQQMILLDTHRWLRDLNEINVKKSTLHLLLGLHASHVCIVSSLIPELLVASSSSKVVGNPPLAVLFQF